MGVVQMEYRGLMRISSLRNRLFLTDSALGRLTQKCPDVHNPPLGFRRRAKVGVVHPIEYQWYSAFGQ